MTHNSGGSGRPVKRRNVLRAAGATVLSGSLAGCLSHTMEKKARPVGIPPEKANEAGYEPKPEIETVTVEREQSVGPVSVKATITSYIVQYEYVGTDGAQESYGGYDESGATETVGVATLAVTPKVSVAGREFNDVTQADINELVEKRTGLFEKFCNCKIGHPGQINVKRVDNPTKTQVDGDTDAYVLARPGCKNPNTVCIASADTQNPLEMLGQKITSEDVTAVFVPDFENKKAYYVIGTKVFNETQNGTDAVFSFYIGSDGLSGTVIQTEDGGTCNPACYLAVEPNAEQKGLFTTEQIREFNGRFARVLRTDGAPSGLSA